MERCQLFVPPRDGLEDMNLRPVELRHLCQAVNHLSRAGPLQGGWVFLWPPVDIRRRVLHNKIAVRLFSKPAVSFRGQVKLVMKRGTYRRETIGIENKRVQQLAKREGLQHPAPKPPRPLPQLTILLPSPREACILDIVPSKLEGSEGRVYGDSDAELLRGVDAESKTRQRGANCRSVHGGDKAGHRRISLPPRLRGRVEDHDPEPRKKAEQNPVQQQDRAKR